MKQIIIKSLKGYKWKILLQVTLICINMYLITYTPKIIGRIIDLLYDIPNNKTQIINYTYFLLGMCILIMIVRVSWKYYEGYISRGFEKDIKDKMFERFLKIKLGKLQQIKNGEIMSYFVKDTNEIRSAVYRILSHGVRIVATFVIVFCAMAQGVNFKLAVFTMCPIILTAFMIVKIKNHVEKSFRKSQECFTDMSEYVQESTDSIRTTKAYSCETEQLKDFIRKNRRVRASDNTVDVFSNLLTACINIGFGLCYGISLIYGSKLVLDQVITVGDFVAFNGYIGLFVGPVSWLPPLIARFKRAQISYERLNKVFELEREKISVKNAKIETELKGKIQINDLTYHYPDCIEPTLRNIGLTIEAGETLGIIGTTASGKTTLMNLILRLYSVERGKIIIDGRDINDIPIEELRSNICYITQDNFLFSTTLKDNISLFKDEYEDSDVIDSTKKALVYDDIMQMEDGINTVICERGTDLSGGQKQRVVISRAFLMFKMI